MNVLMHREGHRIASEVEGAKIRTSDVGRHVSTSTCLASNPALAPTSTPHAMARHLAGLLDNVVACARDCVAGRASNAGGSRRDLPDRWLVGAAPFPAARCAARSLASS